MLSFASNGPRNVKTRVVFVKHPATLPSRWRTYGDALYGIPTPAFVYDEEYLKTTRDLVSEIKTAANCRILYALKAMPFGGILRDLEPALDGFAASSLFEAKLVRELFPAKSVHFTTPGLQPSELASLSNVCDYISLNSANHVRVLAPRLKGRASLGIRINTELSFVDDFRYDPCRTHSKLGVPISQLQNLDWDEWFSGIQGIHVHTNADSTDFSELTANVDALCANLRYCPRIAWVNLGGGYLFDEVPSIRPLADAIDTVRNRFNADVFLEPGAALVRNSSVLVSQVVDLFDVDGRRIAVLDTSVNHMPEVLEFSYQPDVLEQSENGQHEYILAGSTCLAGDVFGTYRFNSELDIGGRVVFTGCGAYTLAKAHRFNGVNLPAIWSRDMNGVLHLRKQYSFENYKEQWLPDV